MSETLLLTIIGSLGLLGGIGLGVKAFVERQVLKARAGAEDASATAVVTAAARELIDPLRKELALERNEHAGEIEALRKQTKALNDDLTEVHEHVRQLRTELSKAWQENTLLRAQLAKKD